MSLTMKAIGFTQSLAITEQDSLFEFETSLPELKNNDLLVKVSATSINPADAKIRIRNAKDKTLELPKVLGYDAVGEVVGKGADVEGFKVGDRVYYAGDVTRMGANAEYQVVDYRITAKAPKSLSDEAAAVMPLATLTAWEALFDRLRVRPEEKKSILIIGGAGGVGSITIQLAKQLTNLNVIATASRPETEQWVRDMGADYVVNHRNLVESVREQGIQHVDYIFNVADTKGHWESMVELIAPQGMISSIVEFDGGIDLSALQGKSAGFVWELMFTRSLFNTEDIQKQQDILFQAANLIDAGRIKTTLTTTLNGFSVDTIKDAHQRIESSASIGKTAIKY
ncbi:MULTISPECIES: zinc-binding alcohol dehydrogenase family protein [Vibrio]|uniref:zinc-binding alcohol dehydrogenase family protein n=1 Tax=Vibrio TaxID=662 RepID=UPI000C83D99B|nr:MULTISPECIES: zinc-binding alcohol dehydrogenase family protein [unclassified Vibrio]PMI24951.1 NADPH:quinone reductase [Vibrio sp. 10N.286.46.E10]PMI97211.1 NADPH:quinone reductase [Vibrio sp. 10N.286.45.E10]PTP10565.1 zinc-binding alcohol dehydrogenase family protein [Vibrio sp. 10N.286.45.A3]PTQ25540.1 zinc-binding alcohol dehydrogenase family protein [Vibrio sp. 10N.286.46.E10]TKE84033.1 zinc-binding alcohol dehydrogenase family protein [Vibrio sp. F12]